MNTWIAIAHPGLEPSVAAELTEHGFRPEIQPGWVRFQAEAQAVCTAMPMLRTPDRMLMQVVEGRFSGSDGLAALVRAQNWKGLLAPEATLEVAVSGGGTALRFKDSVQKRIVWAIGESLKGPRIPERYARPRLTQRIAVRADGDRATISLDAGGDLLYRRGWRTDVSKAPLRENIAATLLRLAGWSPSAPLLDPFCGSGTIPIEAALWASGRSAFVNTTFAWHEWPMAKGWGAKPGRPRSPPSAILGSDRDPKCVQAALANAKRAGVSVQWSAADVSALTPPAPTGYLVTNPPWGHRLNDDASARVIPARDIFDRFATVVNEQFRSWHVVFLAPEQDLARRVSPRVKPLATFPNGGLRVTAWGIAPEERSQF